MKIVDITNRNKNKKCERCNEKIGEIEKKAYSWHNGRSHHMKYYCLFCGNFMVDTPTMRELHG